MMGNKFKKTDLDDAREGNHIYNWNADNRLVEVKQGTSQATAIPIARYSYDANGNRVQKTELGQNTSPDKVTTYLVDESFAYAQTVQESTTQGGNTDSTSFVWGNGLIQQSRAGQLSYYHADALGSTKTLTDANGNITDTYQYDAFGAVLNRTGTTTNNYRYTGEYTDDTISLQYNRARWYDASAGRFVSMDTFVGALVRPVTLNKFLYADANPISKRDPSGKFGLAETMTAVNNGLILTNIAVTSYNVTSDVMAGEYGKAAGELAISMVIGKLGSSNFMRSVVAKSFGIFAMLTRSTPRCQNSCRVIR